MRSPAEGVLEDVIVWVMDEQSLGLSSKDVRAAVGSDVAELAALLGRAFDDDPVYQWLFPDREVRRLQSPRMFLVLLRQSIGHGFVLTDPDRRGAALWRPPNMKMGPFEEVVFSVRMAWLLGRRARQIGQGFAPLERRHPVEPHAYLPLLGTDPASQGKGVGSSLLSPALAWCDRNRLPAYLESSKETNIPFYQRHGFEVTEAITIKDGPTVWPMLRRPV